MSTGSPTGRSCARRGRRAPHGQCLGDVRPPRDRRQVRGGLRPCRDPPASSPSLRRGRLGLALAHVRVEQRLDLRRGRAPLEARNDTPAFDQREGLAPPPMPKRFARSRPLVDVDLLHAERVPLLAGDMGEQALHPARGRAAGREEDEQRAWVATRGLRWRIGLSGQERPPGRERRTCLPGYAGRDGSVVLDRRQRRARRGRGRPRRSLRTPRGRCCCGCRDCGRNRHRLRDRRLAARWPGRRDQAARAAVWPACSVPR